MKATEFCKYFEFMLTREHGFDEEDGEYNYVATDNQGVFHARHVTDVNELTDMFDICLESYVDSILEEDGFIADEYSGTFYQQAYIWAKNREDYKGTSLLKVIEALATGKLEDDLEEEDNG